MTFRLVRTLFDFYARSPSLRACVLEEGDLLLHHVEFENVFARLRRRGNLERHDRFLAGPEVARQIGSTVRVVNERFAVRAEPDVRGVELILAVLSPARVPNILTLIFDDDVHGRLLAGTQRDGRVRSVESGDEGVFAERSVRFAHFGVCWTAARRLASLRREDFNERHL